MMKRLGLVLMVLILGGAFGQTPRSDGPPSGRLDAIIQVYRDSINANLLKVSPLDSRYSISDLRAQIARLGVLTGAGVRGVQLSTSPIDPKDPASQALRATFATDGLIARTGEWVKIAPIVKAFAGTSKTPGLTNFQIGFDNETATALDLGNYSSDELEVERRQVDRTIEYTVYVKRRGPDEVQIPDFATGPVTHAMPIEKPQRDWFVIAVIGVVIVAVGALVYSLFILKPSPRKVKR